MPQTQQGWIFEDYLLRLSTAYGLYDPAHNLTGGIVPRVLTRFLGRNHFNSDDLAFEPVNCRNVYLCRVSYSAPKNVDICSKNSRKYPNSNKLSSWNLSLCRGVVGPGILRSLVDTCDKYQISMQYAQCDGAVSYHRTTAVFGINENPQFHDVMRQEPVNPQTAYRSIRQFQIKPVPDRTVVRA